MHLACKEGNKELVIEILQIFELKNTPLEEIISKEDNKKWTPIYYAIDDTENGFRDIFGSLNKLTYRSIAKERGESK